MTAHLALMYRREDAFVSGLLPFVLEGIGSGEGVFAAAAPANLEALRSALGTVSDDVRFVDATEWYVKPAQTLGTYLSFIHDQLRDGRPAVRIIGEVASWPERDAELRREWTRYESAFNAVFAGLPVRLICPYDTASLTPSTIEAARATHPEVIEEGTVWASGRYVPPERLLVDLAVRMRLPERREQRIIRAGDVGGPISFVLDRARKAGLTEDAASNAAAAAGEVVRHAAARGNGPLLVAVWWDDAGFVCQIEDELADPSDPLAGYGPPPPDAPDRWGLWLARQLSDLLEVGVGERGAVVRLTMRPPSTGRSSARSPTPPSA